MSSAFLSWLDPISLETILILAGFFAAAGLGVLAYEHVKKTVDANLRKRYSSWFVIAPVVLIPAYFGNIPFAVLVCALSLYCMREFFNVVHVWDTPVYKWVGRIAGLALVVAALLETQAPYPALQRVSGSIAGHSITHGQPLFSIVHPFYILPVFIIMLVLTIPVILQKYEGMLVKESFTIFGILYFGWFLAHLVFLRHLPGGFGYIIFLSMVVVCNDVMAYTVGRLWGKTKLAPTISPKKTCEGALGGLIGSLLAAVIFRYTVPELSWAAVIGTATLIGVAAPLGDLVISVIKRDMSVKDSGNLIPGHGGLLDRCDSLIFATPIFYYSLIFIMYFR